MTASTLGLLIIAIVTVIVLAIWIALVFHADAHPAWRWQVPSGHDTSARLRMTARREEESTDYASREAEGSASARPDVGASAAPTGGIAPGQGEDRVIPDRSAGRPSLHNRVNRSSGAAGKRRRPGVAAAYAAAILAFAYAAVSMYWAAGGTALLSTVGGSIEDIGRHGGLPAVALGLASAGLKLAGGILALALVRPWGRAIPRAWLLPCAAGASAMLACYGAIQVTAGSLVLSRVVRPAAPVDWTALGWHVLVWDMWFLIWGILMATAAAAWWRQGRRRGPAASLTARNGHADLA